MNSTDQMRAHESYRRLAVLAPDNDAGWVLMAHADIAARKYKAALEEIDRALALLGTISRRCEIELDF